MFLLEQLPNPLKPQMSLFCALKAYSNHHKYLFTLHTPSGSFLMWFCIDHKEGECRKTWENAAKMLFVFQSIVLSRHLGLHVWVWSVPDGTKGNIAKDLNVVYQSSGRTFHLWNALSFFFCGHSDSWSVFLWAEREWKLFSSSSFQLLLVFLRQASLLSL